VDDGYSPQARFFVRPKCTSDKEAKWSCEVMTPSEEIFIVDRLRDCITPFICILKSNLTVIFYCNA
jgi:hypothetical protein